MILTPGRVRIEQGGVLMVLMTPDDIRVQVRSQVSKHMPDYDEETSERILNDPETSLCSFSTEHTRLLLDFTVFYSV